MKLYHDTTKEAWESIKSSGYIFSKEKEVYTNIKPNVAKSFGDVVLEIDIDDNIIKDKINNGEIYYRKSVHDYIFCENIPIKLVKVYSEVIRMGIIKRWEARFSVKVPDDYRGDAFLEDGKVNYLAIIEMNNKGIYYSHLHKIHKDYVFEDEMPCLWSRSLGSAKRRFNMDCDWKAGSWDWKEVEIK